MGIVARRFEDVAPSATVAITFLAREMARQGREVIELSAGEPDFDTPPHIREAAVAAIGQGKSRYAPPAGIPELREAICRKLKRDNGLDYDPAEISVGCGAKQSIFNVLMATIDPGDEIIVPAPNWVSFADAAAMMGGVPVAVPAGPDVGFKLQPESLERAITPRTKWLVLCSPSNPTGAVYSVDELRAIGDVLARHPQVMVLSDHIYEHLVYNGAKSSTIGEVCPQLRDRTVIINGVSKAYCMTGWRVGFAAAPKRITTTVNAIQSQSTTSTSTISQWAAVAAFDGDQSFMAGNNREFRRRRDMVVEMLNRAAGIGCMTPDGAFYVYPSSAGVIGKKTPDGRTIGSDRDFVEYLLRDQGVAVVHGEAFNLSPHFRISYAASFDVLERACLKIQEACEALR